MSSRVMILIGSSRFACSESNSTRPVSFSAVKASFEQVSWRAHSQGVLRIRVSPKGDFAATIVFVDMAAQHAGHALDHHRRGIQAAPCGCGRTVGDGVFLVFYGHRIPRHAKDALAAMVAIKRGIGQAGDEFDERFGVRPSLTFGVETGFIASRILKTMDHLEASLFGATIHLAARLQSECGKVGAEAFAGPVFAATFPQSLSLVGTRDLKGFGETEVYRVDLDV